MIARLRGCSAGGAALFLLPALARRLLIPAGFMPGSGDGLCAALPLCRADAGVAL